MTINYSLGKEKCRSLRIFNEIYECNIHVDWVSHGNYSIWTEVVAYEYQLFNKIFKTKTEAVYLEMELEFFDDILNAAPTQQIQVQLKNWQDYFQPFYEGVVPPRGMNLGWWSSLKAYPQWIQNELFIVLHQQCSGIFSESPSNIIKELKIHRDDFVKLRNIAVESKKERTFHYVF